MKVHAIVLAAGLSRRMGYEKLLLPLGGRPLFTHCLQSLAGLPLQGVTLVYASEEVAQAAAEYGVALQHNPHPEHGHAASVVLGLGAAPAADGYLFLQADQPFVSSAVLGGMLQAFTATPQRIVAAALNGKPCSPVLFPHSLRGELLALQAGEGGGRAVLRRHPELVTLFALPHPAQALDIDTQEEYLQAQRYLAEGRA